DHDDLDADEWHRPPIDLSGRDLGGELAGYPVEEILLRRDAAQIEECKAEGRVHERGLHVDPEEDAEPDEVDPQLLGRRAKQRDDDEGEFEEIEEECEEEGEELGEDEKPDLTA